MRSIPEFLLIFLLSCGILRSQVNTAARYEIDAKRIGVYPYSKDALPRSREFIRLDSTYYVGHMYEGLYKFERSADFHGYRNAIGPLNKAFQLLQKDFGKQLRQIYSSFDVFERYKTRYDDFYRLAESLKTCYNNIEWPDSTMSLLDQIESYNFQRDFFSIDSDRAWTYHRNRFYTSDKYPFLKNSIAENEKAAFECCYRQMRNIRKNKFLNNMWFGYTHEEEDLMTVYHYIAILHDYNQNYDSSLHYYNLLIKGGRVSWGNYAHLNEELGNFREAITHFSKTQYRMRYSLSESAYYLPSLLLYGGRTKDAIAMSRERVASSASTPGFGWYTIALARSCLYDAQLDSAEYFLDKAAGFRELHIGTTLTQSQYEFTINLLRVQLMDRRISLIKFMDKGWWYSPCALWQLCKLESEKLLLQYNVVNALAANPERKRLMYDLFCGETTFTFDESMYLLRDFATGFFIRKYENYQQEDKRQKIYRYFRYFTARFRYENGDERGALEDCERVLQNSMAANSEAKGQEIDVESERLLLARLYELMALCVKENSPAFTFNRSRMFEQFPQLVPFSNLEFEMNLSFSGEDDAFIRQIRNEIGASKIRIPAEVSADAPVATVQFSKKGKYYLAVVSVKNSAGETMIAPQRLILKEGDRPAEKIVLALFGSGYSPEPEI